MRTVAICMSTLHRPLGLRRALEGIAAQSLGGLTDVDVRVVIVDNDADGSAEAVVQACREQVPWPITYVVEPTRGIPFARNAAVAAALPVDFVAFLDDDEVPDTGWLAELLRVQAATGADVVTGPVLPLFDEEPPHWVRAGRFFERDRFPTGHRMHYARTSNVLVAADVFGGRPRPFDERLGLNGGDDTHLFRRALLEGHTVVWADDACVTESVPASRVTLPWLVKRHYRNGNTLSLCLRDLEYSTGRVLKRIGRVGWEAGWGAADLLAALAGGRRFLVRGLQRIAFAAGLLTGLTGHRYEEYTQVHGT